MTAFVFLGKWLRLTVKLDLVFQKYSNNQYFILFYFFIILVCVGKKIQIKKAPWHLKRKVNFGVPKKLNA